MISSTAICNLALSRFGGGEITSLDEETETARLLSINYENCLQTVLRDFPWSFARKIDTLDLLSVETTGWDYTYLYPTDCVKILKVYTEGDGNVTNLKNEYKSIASSDGLKQYIVSNIENAYIEYTIKSPSTSIYDPQFVKALSYMLAAEVSNSISGNTSLSNNMMQKYQLAINDAKTSAANENTTPFELQSSYTRGRR